MRHWTVLGLQALGTELARDWTDERFCVGAQPTIAGCCVVPQLFHAARFGVDLGPYPTLRAIDAACQALPAFRDAHPSVQPDAD